MTEQSAAAEFHSEFSIAADHPAYAGHFPDFPVLPGALLLDEALRAMVRTHGLDLEDWRIDSAKFLQIVRPGTALSLRHSWSDGTTIRFAIMAGSVRVAAGMLSAAASTPRKTHGD